MEKKRCESSFEETRENSVVMSFLLQSLVRGFTIASEPVKDHFVGIVKLSFLEDLRSLEDAPIPIVALEFVLVLECHFIC